MILERSVADCKLKDRRKVPLLGGTVLCFRGAVHLFWRTVFRRETAAKSYFVRFFLSRGGKMNIQVKQPFLSRVWFPKKGELPL
jgi:hypothetical protein